MTREERHIAVLSRLLESMDVYDSIQPTEERKKAIKAAIKALSQEPICDRDCEHCTWTECPIEPCEKPTTEDAIKTIQELMIACTPDSKYYRVGQMAISAMLENEELSKDLDEALKEIDGYERGLSQEPCDNAISREAVLSAICDYVAFEEYEDKSHTFTIRPLTKRIKQLPSVTPSYKECRTLDEFIEEQRRNGE